MVGTVYYYYYEVVKLQRAVSSGLDNPGMFMTGVRPQQMGR